MDGKLITILLPAVGGQGGGVLTEWLYQAFLSEDYEVQGISLPGLSQRAGSTVYYIEAFRGGGADSVIFSQHPVPGEVDVIIAQEFLELGRILEQGYGSDNTTVISSTHRIYSTVEKLPVGTGIYSEENLRSIAERFSSAFYGINTIEVAREGGMNERAVNAILLGLLYRSGCLPLSGDSYLNAIRKTGIAVDENIKAFELGASLDLSAEGGNDKVSCNGYFKKELLDRYSVPEKEIEELLRIASSAGEELPVHLRDILNEALVRLTDYQGLWYAEEFLKKLKGVFRIDRSHPGKDFRLSELCIKNLALLMSYEDGIRVAELKIRRGRFRRIKNDMSLGDNQIFHVTDYLKPDSEEIYGLMPDFLVSPVLNLMENGIIPGFSNRKKPLTFAQTPTTSSFSGFLKMWLLTRLKPLRPYSYRYKKEHAVIDKYLDSVCFFAENDYELGCLVAMSGSMVKGYGRVRRRTVDTFNRFIDNVIQILFLYEKDNDNGFPVTKDIARRSVDLISGEEDGIVRAEKLVNEILSGRKS